MAEITAKAVMRLRKMSGQGMMDCKKALGESGGDLDEAISILRKKGLATMAKRAGRETSEGRVVTKRSADGKTTILATLCCETDFASKSEDFVSTVDQLGECCLNCESDGVEAVLDTEFDGRKFSEILNEVISKTGEKTEVGDVGRLTLSGCGVIGSYVHFNNKLGTIVEIEADNDSTAAGLADVAVGVAMHITAINPSGVDRDSIDASVIEKERAIAADQVKDKPENIIEKIIEGKLNKFFKECCLVDQIFVKDDSMTVGEAVSNAAKASGGEAKIKKFIRFEIG